MAVPGDVVAPASTEQLLEVAGRMGQLKVAVAAAGQARSAPWHRTSAEDMRALFDVNALAPFRLLQGAADRMRARKEGGRLIVVASTAAVRGARYTTAYAASKHAALGMVRSMALELASEKITVNAVCPGWVDTPLMADAVDNIAQKTGLNSDEARARLLSSVPAGRALMPAEVAATVAYLVSDEAAMLTGQALVVDGGEGL